MVLFYYFNYKMKEVIYLMFQFINIVTFKLNLSLIYKHIYSN